MRYLKQQERRQQTTVSESEKLQRLKDRVESQESKLKKIRAMRGQVDYSKVINGNLCKCSEKDVQPGFTINWSIRCNKVNVCLMISPFLMSSSRD